MSSGADHVHKLLRQRLRQLMTARGFSVNRLADFSGIGRGRLSEILAGKSSPTLRTLAKLADALESPVVDLLSEPSKNASTRRQ